MPLIVQVAYNIIVPLLLVTGVGFLFKRRFAPDGRTLSSAAFYVFSPALVLRGIAESDIQAGEIGRILALVLMLALLLVILSKGLARLLGFSRSLETAFTLSILFMIRSSVDPSRPGLYLWVGYPVAVTSRHEVRCCARRPRLSSG